MARKLKRQAHSCPCRLFREHWDINLPRADFKGSTASLKSCHSESVKKNLVRRFLGDLWRFSPEKRDFYTIVHNDDLERSWIAVSEPIFK